MDMTAFLTDNRTLFIENYVLGLGAGLTVWFLTWGLNRAYLTFKTFVS